MMYLIIGGFCFWLGASIIMAGAIYFADCSICQEQGKDFFKHYLRNAMAHSCIFIIGIALLLGGLHFLVEFRDANIVVIKDEKCLK